MDIKLKSIKYSSITKIIAFFLVWLCFMSAAASGLYLLYNEDVLSSKSYYETRNFTEEYSRLVHNAAEFNIKFKNKDGIISFGNSLDNISENANRYELIKNKLDGIVNFSYYVKNNGTGEVKGNVNTADPVALLKKQPTYVYYNREVSSGNILWYQNDIRSMLAGTNYEIHAALIEPLKPGDAFYEGFNRFSKVKAVVPYIITAIIASVILMLAAFIYLVYATGRREEDKVIVLNSIDRIYTDVHGILVFIAAILSVVIVSNVSSGSDNTTFFIAAAIILSIDMLIGLSYVLSMVRQIKNRQLFTNSLIYKVLVEAKKVAILAFGGRLFKSWTILVLLGYGAVNGVLLTIFLFSWRYEGGFEFLFSGLLLMGFNFAAIYFAVKSLRSLTEIMEAAKELASGNLD